MSKSRSTWYGPCVLLTTVSISHQHHHLQLDVAVLTRRLHAVSLRLDDVRRDGRRCRPGQAAPRRRRPHETRSSSRRRRRGAVDGRLQRRCRRRRAPSTTTHRSVGRRVGDGRGWRPATTARRAPSHNGHGARYCSGGLRYFGPWAEINCGPKFTFLSRDYVSANHRTLIID